VVRESAAVYGDPRTDGQVRQVVAELLQHEVAGLPTELDPDSEEAKRFDLPVLNLQLALLRAEPALTRLRDQVKEIAGLLGRSAKLPSIN